MPASSFSGVNSWGLYLVAALALVLLFTPQLTGLVRFSREAADWRYADGVREAVDALRPGATVNLAFASFLAPDPVVLGGHHLSCDYGSGSLTFASAWSLPNVTLSPSSRYTLWLSGSQVMVERG